MGHGGWEGCPSIAGRGGVGGAHREREVAGVSPVSRVGAVVPCLGRERGSWQRRVTRRWDWKRASGPALSQGRQVGAGRSLSGTRLRAGRSRMPEGQGAPPSPRAARSAPDRRSSEPALCPQSQILAPGSRGFRGFPGSPAPRRGAAHSCVPQKLAEARSSQYGLNVFVAGLLLLLAWAVHAAGVGKSHLLCALTALMLLQLLWMLWYVGRRAAHRRLARPKDTHAGARWLRGECGREAGECAGPACSPARRLQPGAPCPPRPLPVSLFCLRLLCVFPGSPSPPSLPSGLPLSWGSLEAAVASSLPSGSGLASHGQSFH